MKEEMIYTTPCLIPFDLIRYYPVNGASGPVDPDDPDDGDDF